MYVYNNTIIPVQYLVDIYSYYVIILLYKSRRWRREKRKISFLQRFTFPIYI